MIYGATESHPLALPARESNVFDRMEALGPGLPSDSQTIRAGLPLDYAIASRGFHEGVDFAMNSVEEWGARPLPAADRGLGVIDEVVEAVRPGLGAG